MRWTHFIFLQCLLLLVIGGIGYIHKDRVIIIKKPPASLAQWYKPENKRQVWLHNMFKLRREMQAVKFYADNNDEEHLKKWLARLSEHYLKIGEMVPEWGEKLDLDVLTSLQQQAESRDYLGVSRVLDDLNDRCESCHADYRMVTASMYRIPDFSSMEINSSTPLNEHMQILTEQVNQIKIASEDAMIDVALSTLSNLKKGVNELGKTCSNCHKKGTMIYPDDDIEKTIAKLDKVLRTGTLKEQGRELGTLAVMACARCHGTHRLAFDVRTTFTETPNWLDLVKH